LWLIVGVNLAASQVAVDCHAWILNDVAEGASVAVITVASVSLGLAVIENAITGDASVLVASSQIFFCERAVRSGPATWAVACMTVEIVEAQSSVFAWVFWVAVIVFVDFVEDPWEEMIDIRVDAGVLSLRAADTEGNDSSKNFLVLVHRHMMLRNVQVRSVTNERSTRIALASVAASLFVSCANVLVEIDENIVVVVPVLAHGRRENGNIDLVQDSVISGKSSVTPSSNDAFHASELLRIRWRELIRQADWPDAFVEFNVLLCLQDADIVQNLSLRDFVFFVALD